MVAGRSHTDLLDDGTGAAPPRRGNGSWSEWRARLADATRRWHNFNHDRPPGPASGGHQAPASARLSPAVPLLRGWLANQELPGPSGTGGRLVVGGLGGFVYLRQQPGSRWSHPGSQHRGYKRDRSRPPKGCRRSLPGRDGRSAFRLPLGVDHGCSGQATFAPGLVPVHAHPTREWAQRHLGSKFGKTEAWIFLETPGDGSEPAHAGLGFTPGVERAWFADAVRRHDSASIRGALHRTDVQPGDVFVAHAGVPHYLGPGCRSSRCRSPVTSWLLRRRQSGTSLGRPWA